ncbi:MAG: hypothetical protein LBF85_00575 [Tannerella sp.]|jgi:hypothetical protein|nr:hypothetical protein [Tannerella sp.]
MAGWYGSLNCVDEALKLYALAPEYPIALYRSAYLLSRQGDSRSDSLLQKAESLPVRMVFPFRAETVPALEWAAGKSEKWVNKYYLAILYGFLGEDEKASVLWKQCADVPSVADSIFYWYRSQDDETLFHTGDTCEIAGMMADSVFYVAAPEEDTLPAAAKGDNVRAYAGTLYVHTKKGVTVRVYTSDGILRDAFITTADAGGVAGAGTAAAGTASNAASTTSISAGTASNAATIAGNTAAGKDSEDSSATDSIRGLTTRRLHAPGVYIVTLDGGPGWKVAVRM